MEKARIYSRRTEDFKIYIFKTWHWGSPVMKVQVRDTLGVIGIRGSELGFWGEADSTGCSGEVLRCICAHLLLNQQLSSRYLASAQALILPIKGELFAIIKSFLGFVNLGNDPKEL